MNTAMPPVHQDHARASDPFFDDPFFAHVLSNPEARAAFEDAQERNTLLDSLVKLRHLKKLTQKAVAERMGVTQPTVSGFETEGSDPRLSTVQRYARAVEATVKVRASVPNHCDWVNRSEAYQAADPAQNVLAVRTEPTTPRAAHWAARGKVVAFVRPGAA